MKILFLMIATVLFANTTHAAAGDCDAGDVTYHKCRLSGNTGYYNAPPSPVKDFSFCSDGKGKIFLNLDTAIHPSIRGTRFELEANFDGTFYVWEDMVNKKVIKVDFLLYRSRGFPLSMRLGALDFSNNKPVGLTSISAYQCTN